MLKKFKLYFISHLLDKTNDVFEKSQIELTFRLIIIWIILFSLLMASYIPLPVTTSFLVFHYVFMATVVISLILLKIGKSHKLPSILVIGTMSLLNPIMLFYFHGNQTAESSLWYMFIIINTFILLGKTWGWISGIFFTALLLTGLLSITYKWDIFNIGLNVGIDITADPLSHAIPIILNIYSLSHYLSATKRAKTIISTQKVELEQAHNNITDSINYAKRIQSAILPPAKSIKEQLPASFILYKPKDIVAGDFYWMEPIENGVLIAAADCTGHGVPGAMVSVICNSALNRAVREFGISTPALILDKARELVTKEFEKSENEVKDGMDIALCRINGHKLSFAGANNPLWIVRDKMVIETKGDKQPVGNTDNPRPFTNHTFELKKGDHIYLFSDGYADQFGETTNKKYMSKRLKEKLISVQDYPMEEQCRLLDKELEDWKGSFEQVDDVCVIGIKIQD